MKEEKQEIKRQSWILCSSGQSLGGFIYLEHLWRSAGLQQRQPWPETALSSCLALKGQQHINQSENKEGKCVEATKSIMQLCYEQATHAYI